MKTSTKLIAVVFTAAALFFTMNVQAQTTSAKTFALSFGLEPGLPTGNASGFTAFTLGGTVRLQYGLSDKVAVTLTTGGTIFFQKRYRELMLDMAATA